MYACSRARILSRNVPNRCAQLAHSQKATQQLRPHPDRIWHVDAHRPQRKGAIRRSKGLVRSTQNEKNAVLPQRQPRLTHPNQRSPPLTPKAAKEKERVVLLHRFSGRLPRTLQGLQLLTAATMATMATRSRRMVMSLELSTGRNAQPYLLEQQQAVHRRRQRPPPQHPSRVSGFLHSTSRSRWAAGSCSTLSAWRNVF